MPEFSAGKVTDYAEGDRKVLDAGRVDPVVIGDCDAHDVRPSRGGGHQAKRAGEG